MAYRPFIPQDYKNLTRPKGSWKRPSSRWLYPAGLAALALGAWLVWPSSGPAPLLQAAEKESTLALSVPARKASTADLGDAATGQSESGQAQPVSNRAQSHAGEPAPRLFTDLSVDQSATDHETAHDWAWATVAPGDSLASIFSGFGLSPVTVHNVVYTNEYTATLRDLMPGQKLAFELNSNGELQALQFELDEVRLVQVLRDGDEFTSKLIERPLEIRIKQASGVIEHSLYLAGLKAGLSDALIMQLAHIYAWDIDFVYDIRTGDRFYFMYEEVYREGEYLRDGNILAATFINRGEPIRAVRYETSDGVVDYYTPDGRNMRKEFLRTPVDFRRISSRFNPNRMHPTLGYRRPHEGVDYAADSGTPVIATGDGRVERASRYGGYGNCIIINHTGSFETLYAHLSKYARGVREGARVEQGQIIGYVGMTGTATGPHLHYEFHVNGQLRDPLKVEFPPAPPLPESEMARFKQHAQPLFAKLDAMDDGNTLYAAKQAP